MAAGPGPDRQRLGLCVILDTCGRGNDAEKLNSLFTDLGYYTQQLDSGIDIRKYLKDNTKKTDGSAVVIMIEDVTGRFLNLQDYINNYSSIFKGCKKLKNKPKILINHIYCSDCFKLKQPKDSQVVHICSQINGGNKNEQSLFIKSLDAVLRRCGNQYDIYDLLTKVLRDVEIHQYISKRNNRNGAGEVPYHGVMFKSSLTSPFRFRGRLATLEIGNETDIEIEGANRDDFEIEGASRDDILQRTLHVNDGDKLKIKFKNGFRLFLATIRLQRCNAVTFKYQMNSKRVAVTFGLAELELTKIPKIKCLKMKIHGSGCIDHITLRDSDNIKDLNGKNWNLKLNGKQVEPSTYRVHHKALMVRTNGDGNVKTTFRIIPAAKFYLKSAKLDVRYAENVTFEWTDEKDETHSDKWDLSDTRDWKQVFIRGVNIPSYDIGELRITIQSSHMYVDVKELRIIANFNDETHMIDETYVIKKDREALSSTEKKNLLCGDERYAEVNNGNIIKVKPELGDTFRLKSITMRSRYCSQLDFTCKYVDGSDSILVSVEPSETQYWEDVCIPNSKIPVQLIKELSVKIIDSDSPGHIKDLRLTAFFEGNPIITPEDSTPNIMLNDDSVPSIYGPFCLSPGQYKDPLLVSPDLKTVFSLDVDIRQEKWKNHPYYKGSEMGKIKRGFAIIINMSNDRPGALVDEVKMKQLMDELFFETRVISNRTHTEIREEIQQLRKEIIRDHECVIVILMGHGTVKPESADMNKLHQFVDVEGTLRPSSYIFDEFDGTRCPKLIGSPKLFIIQTCFGSERSTQVSREVDATPSNNNIPASSSRTVAPSVKSDIFRMHATVPGCVSYRRGFDGSLLLQGLDEIFRTELANTEIDAIWKMVMQWINHEMANKKEKQQAQIETQLTGTFLYLNPGYIVSKQPQLPDTPEKRKDGSVIWQDTANSVYIADSQADKDSVRITHMNVDTEPENTVHLHLPVNRVMSGVSVNEIVGIIGRDNKGDCKALFATKKNDGLWDSDRLRRLSIDDPLALCSVNNDGIAVLCGQIGSIKATIQVYTCFDIIRGLDKDGSVIDSDPDRIITLISTRKPFCLGIRDKMCYFKTKFYLSCFHTSMVYQFNIDGKYEHKFGEPASSISLEDAGKLFKPCGIFINDTENDEKLIIACYNGIHHVSLKTKEWSPVVKSVECGHGLWYNNDKIITIKDSGLGTEKTEKELPRVPDNRNDGTVTEAGDVIWENTQTSVFVAKGRTIKLMDLGDNVNTSNYSLGEPSVETNVETIISGVVIGRWGEYIEHCIVVKRYDGSRRALRVWSEKSVWRAIISVELNDPLLVCSINSSINSNEKIAVLSGKYASAYATIVILKKEDVGQDAKIKSLREISICSISPPTRPLSLGTRDKMCYYNKHFYISCFNSSTVYQVDIDGKVLQTYSGDKMIGPCAVFAGKRDNTDHITIACANGTIHEGVVTQNVSLSNSQISHKAKGLWYTSEVVVAIQANEEHKFYPAEYQVNAETKVHESATVELKKNRDKVGINSLPGSVIHVTEDTIMVFNQARKQKKPQFTLVEVGNPQNPTHDSLDLPEGTYIRSGVMIREYSVNGNKQRVFMFVVGYMNGEKTNGEYRICTVVLKSGSKTITAMFDFPHVALQAFRIDISQFGVLCSDNNVNRVRVYTQDMLESPSDTTSLNMWGYSDHMIKLERSDGGGNNTISVTSDGHFCLGVYQKGNILIYSAGGMCLTTLKISDGMSEPHSLICTGQNNILVVGKEGHVILYQPNWERITEEKGRGEWVEVRGEEHEMTCHSIVSGNYMWSVELVIKDNDMCLRAYTIQRPG